MECTASIGMRLRAVLGVLCGAAVVVLTPIGNALAGTLPGDNGRLAVLLGTHARSEIGLLRRSGRFQPRQATGRETAIFELSFSPSGTRVAYPVLHGFSAGYPELQILNLRRNEVESVGTRGLSVRAPQFVSGGDIVFSGSDYAERKRGTYRIRPSGARLRRLFEREQLAASADGRWFVATDRGGRFRELILLNHRGRPVARLTGHVSPAVRYLEPAISPSGRWVAFEREVKFGDDPSGGFTRRTDIFVVRRDGRRLRRLTWGGGSHDPAFSPDGRWVAFTRSEPSRDSGRILAASFRHPRRLRALSDAPKLSLSQPAWAPIR